MTKRVLAVDGGGIRGIIPAMVVAHIEKKLHKPASELFDLMVGTSTGVFLPWGWDDQAQADRLSFWQGTW